MAFDIPNYVTLPIELAVAMLILISDRRSRNREQNAALRFQEQQKNAREAEIKQRERFNNWSRESSKRQIMLLESIMATLDHEKVDEFKSQVGSRYTQEITRDISDLEDLLEKRTKDLEDPNLEVDIESKIEEIESAKGFVEHFLPKDTLNQIQKIADSAKTAYDSLRTLPSTFHPDQKPSSEPLGNRTSVVDENTTEDVQETKVRQQEALNKFKYEQKQFLAEIEKSIQDSLNEVKDELQKAGADSVSGKFLDVVRASFLEKGIKEVMKRSTQNNKSEHENDDSKDKEIEKD